MTYDQFVETGVGRPAAFVALHEAAASEHQLGDRPVVVLTRGSTPVRDSTTCMAQARQSTNSRHTRVAGAGHEIHLYAHASVTEAILDVVEASRYQAACALMGHAA